MSRTSRWQAATDLTKAFMQFHPPPFFTLEKYQYKIIKEINS